MIGGVTRRGGLPGLPDQVAHLAEVKFCHVSFQGGLNPPSSGRIGVTWIGFNKVLKLLIASLKVKIGSHSTERLQQEEHVRENTRALTATKRRLPARHFLLYWLCA